MLCYNIINIIIITLLHYTKAERDPRPQQASGRAQEMGSLGRAPGATRPPRPPRATSSSPGWPGGVLCSWFPCRDLALFGKCWIAFSKEPLGQRRLRQSSLPRISTFKHCAHCLRQLIFSVGSYPRQRRPNFQQNNPSLKLAVPRRDSGDTPNEGGSMVLTPSTEAQSEPVLLMPTLIYLTSFRTSQVHSRF